MKNVTLYYATSNKGKFDTAKHFFESYPTITLKQLDVDLPESQTTDQTAIAIEKAKSAWNIIKQPVLVDDGGAYFERYTNFPGTLSKFVYHGLGLQGLYRLFEEGDAASFVLTLVYAYGPDQYKIFEQVVSGSLTKPKEGVPHNTLPYEYIFVPDGYSVTVKELRGTPDFKNVSCRMLVLQQFAQFYF